LINFGSAGPVIPGANPNAELNPARNVESCLFAAERGI